LAEEAEPGVQDVRAPVEMEANECERGVSGPELDGAQQNREIVFPRSQRDSNEDDVSTIVETGMPAGPQSLEETLGLRPTRNLEHECLAERFNRWHAARIAVHAPRPLDPVGLFCEPGMR
jgi:hypothetical protein